MILAIDVGNTHTIFGLFDKKNYSVVGALRVLFRAPKMSLVRLLKIFVMILESQLKK